MEYFVTIRAKNFIGLAEFNFKIEASSAHFAVSIATAWMEGVKWASEHADFPPQLERLTTKPIRGVEYRRM